MTYELVKLTRSRYFHSKTYCPVPVALEGSALLRNTLATALLQNRTGLIVPEVGYNRTLENYCSWIHQVWLHYLF